MDKYYVIDKDKRYILKEITPKEYSIFKQYHKKYKLLESLFYSFSCGNDAVNDYRKLIKAIQEDKYSTDINKAHNIGVYKITSMVLLLRIFRDNAKSYAKRVKSVKTHSEIDKTDNIYEIKILKALRDYAQHYSIPVTNTRMVFNVLKEEMQVHFEIKKEELLENKDNRKNIEVITDYDKDKINFNELINIWEKENQNLFVVILEDFVKNLHFNVKKAYNEHISIYEKDGEEYFPNAFLHKKGKHEITEEILVTNSELNKLIVVSLYNEKK